MRVFNIHGTPNESNTIGMIAFSKGARHRDCGIEAARMSVMATPRDLYALQEPHLIV
jgi:hypothetical protein